MSHAVEDITVVRLAEGVLNEASLRGVQRLLEEAEVPVVHLDLSSVRLPTAAGLGALVILNKELRAREGGLVLVNVPATTYDIFVLTRLVEVLEIRAE
jgi:anti-anti-sigma factor